MKFYHGTTEENWNKIQKEGVLFGVRTILNAEGKPSEEYNPNRMTYLSTTKEEASHYGNVVLEIEYDPTIKPKMNNYAEDCWQLRVYEPIALGNIRKLPDKKRIIRATKPYIRDEIANDSETMYIFTDNVDRDSGKGLIDNNSWYSQKYGIGKHYPKVTTALIRGLDNAYPITTQHWYNRNYKGNNGRWTDSDLEEFKTVIDNDFNNIYDNMNRYYNIVFPLGGIFNSRIANISKERVPQLYNYLLSKCLELKKKYETI